MRKFTNSKMKSISINYAVKYEIDFAPNYKYISNNICVNSKTGRTIKQVYKNRTIGYCICGKFYSSTYLRRHLIKQQKQFYPF